MRPGEGVSRDSNARISSPYVCRRQGPKSVIFASSAWVCGGEELDEAHPLAIGVEAVGFSIDGYDRIRDQSADELTEAVLVSDKK